MRWDDHNHRSVTVAQVKIKIRKSDTASERKRTYISQTIRHHSHSKGLTRFQSKRPRLFKKRIKRVL